MSYLAKITATVEDELDNELNGMMDPANPRVDAVRLSEKAMEMLRSIMLDSGMTENDKCNVITRSYVLRSALQTVLDNASRMTPTPGPFCLLFEMTYAIGAAAGTIDTYWTDMFERTPSRRETLCTMVALYHLQMVEKVDTEGSSKFVSFLRKRLVVLKLLDELKRPSPNERLSKGRVELVSALNRSRGNARVLPQDKFEFFTLCSELQSCLTDVVNSVERWEGDGDKDVSRVENQELSSSLLHTQLTGLQTSNRMVVGVVGLGNSGKSTFNSVLSEVDCFSMSALQVPNVYTRLQGFFNGVNNDGMDELVLRQFKEVPNVPGTYLDPQETRFALTRGEMSEKVRDFLQAARGTVTDVFDFEVNVATKAPEDALNRLALQDFPGLDHLLKENSGDSEQLDVKAKYMGLHERSYNLLRSCDKVVHIVSSTTGWKLEDTQVSVVFEHMMGLSNVFVYASRRSNVYVPRGDASPAEKSEYRDMVIGKLFKDPQKKLLFHF